jgi:hypothetical protein
MDVLRPFHAAIDRAMAPHFQDVFEGDDPADAVQYAVDLINGAEAALRHLGRVIGNVRDL